MSRASGGFPRVSVTCGQLVYLPTDLNWNARAYAGGVETVGNYVNVEGFGIWSIFVVATALGANTVKLHVGYEDGNPDLSIITIAAGHVGSATPVMYMVGPVGTGAFPLVARTVAVGLQSPGPNGAGTIRMFGRAY